MATQMPDRGLSDEIRRRSGWAIFTGFLIAAIGVFLIAYPLATAAITTLLLGWALIFVGIAQFIFALHSHTVGQFFLKILVSMLFVACGVSLVFAPLWGVVVLTALVGTLLLIEAGLLMAIAFHLRPRTGWGWFLADGISSLLLGILILAKWPSSSVWTIGTLIGVSVLIGGLTRVMIATKIRRGAATVVRSIREAA